MNERPEALAPRKAPQTDDPLTELVGEVAQYVTSSRGMGIGEDSIDFGLRHRFRDRLFDALLADIDCTVSPELQERVERRRKATRAQMLAERLTSVPRPTPEQIRDAREAIGYLEQRGAISMTTQKWDWAQSLRALLEYVERTRPTGDTKE